LKAVFQNNKLVKHLRTVHNAQVGVAQCLGWNAEVAPDRKPWGSVMKSITFSVPLRERGMEVAMEEAERLVGPLQGLYGKQKRILGFEVIKVWIQMASEGPRLNLYLEAKESINDTLEAGRDSDNPIDLELFRLFESITDTRWDHLLGQAVYLILDWHAQDSQALNAEGEESS
jgi:hypothetical protein